MITNKTTDRMFRAINETQALTFAHKQGFFKALCNKEKTESELSEATGIPARNLSALVSLFASADPPLIRKTDGKISFAEEGDIYLNPKSDLYMGAIFDLVLGNEKVFSFESFEKTMMKDEPQKPMFVVDELLNRKVTAAMNAKSAGPASVWADAIDLSGYSHLLDIGGGSGIFAINAIKRWQNLKATVYEFYHIAGITEEYITGTPVAITVGNFWEDEFPEADIHFYSDIFHDWTEEQCVFLAQKSFNFLPEGGRIILHELPFNDEKTGPLSAAVYNFSVIRWTPGRQYSKSELMGFLKAAGFGNVEYLPTGYSDWALITGVR